MKAFMIAAAIAALGVSGVAAYADDAHMKKAVTAGAAQAAGQMSDGEVRKVDKEAKKITLRHGPLQNLDMPPMTMVFQVKDPAMLDQVKTGDKVRFEAQKVGGALTVTKIEPMK